ncbi:MAG TPA: AI-2E family transporter [Burkholderiales bacterium]|nr:AI-2E family transporter [Burkholderiales bacterium]
MANRTDAYIRRVTIAAAIGAAAVLLTLALWAASQMLLVVFGGILIAVLLRSLADLVTGYTRLPATAAVWLVLLVLLSVLGGGGWYLWADISSQFGELGQSLTALWDRLRGFLEQQPWGQQLLTVLGDPQSAGGKPGALANAFGAAVAALSGIVISLFIGVYIAVDPTLYRHGVLRLVPRVHRDRAKEIIEELHDTLQRWLLGTLVLMIIVGTMITVGLTLIGIPMALALGFIAFMLEFVPYVGPIVAAIPAVLVAASVGPREVLFVVLLYWAVQSIEGYVLSPLVYQRSIEIPPMLTISAQIVLGTLLGMMGVIFATPLTASAMVLVQRLYVESALGDRLDRPVRD